MAKKAKKQIKKSSVYIETSKGVYPYEVLQKAEKTTSKQVKLSNKWLSENDLIPPPYSPDTLLTLYESNPIFWRCVNQLAIDVTGLGWNLQLIEGKTKSESELKRLHEFLDSPNKNEALRSIFKSLLIDWGAIGDFGIEVVRNNKQEVAEIYHVPAQTINVHSSNEKYCQKRNQKKVWFKKFGLEENISAKDGEKTTGKSKDSANELIFYKNNYPRSDYYGVPNAISAIGDILGLIGLRDYNLAFFENYGVPSAIIVLEGDWDEGADRKIAKFLNKEVQGTDNAHRTLVVTQEENCKFTYEPIESKVKEGSFRLYEQTRRDDILIAYSMPPERIGIRVTGALGANVALEATRSYVQGVVEPLQTDIEDIVNGKLLNSEIYTFKFENIDLRNYTEEVERMNKQIEHGVLTPNEVRNELGLKPYPDGDKFYLMSNLLAIGEPPAELSKTEKDYLDKQQ